MTLAFDPNRTFFRGIKQVQTNTYPFIEKERGKGFREGSRKKRKHTSQSKYLFQKQYWWLRTNGSEVARTKDV